MRHEEHFWVRRAMEGDSNAFGLLATRFLPNIKKWIGVRISPNEVDDLAQETLLRAFRSIGNLSDPERFPQWLRGISLNVVRMHYRSESKNQSPSLEDGDLDTGSNNNHPSRYPAEQRIIAKLRAEQLDEALKDLNTAQSEVLTLHYLDGMSYVQIANTLGLSVGAVKSRLHRGRLAIKERLEEMEDPIMGERDQIEMARIHDVFRAELEGEDTLAIVILKPIDQEVFVPIWVAEAEGEAILLALRGETAPRPLTHDLMGDLLKSAGVRVERVVVTELIGDVFFGEVRVRGSNGAVDVDARPSDAIAVALLTDSDLFIGQDVIDKVGIRDLSPESLRRNPEVEITPLKLPDFDEWKRGPAYKD